MTGVHPENKGMFGKLAAGPTADAFSLVTLMSEMDIDRFERQNTVMFRLQCFRR